MGLKNLIGQRADEKSLFELVQFEVEEHWSAYYGQYILIECEKTPEYFELKQIFFCKDKNEYLEKRKPLFKKKYWLLIDPNEEARIIYLSLLQPNLDAWMARITEEKTDFYPDMCMLDPDEKLEMTEEEFIEGFKELIGIFNDQAAKKSNPKKAV